MLTRTPKDPLSIEHIARIPAGAPWAVRTLAGFLAFELASESSAPFSEAREEVRALARACAIRMTATRQSLFRYHNDEASFVLSPAQPFSQLDGRNAFVLLRSEGDLGYACLWTGTEDPMVFWFDAEDGSHRSVSRLEKWCQDQLRGWSLLFDEDIDDLELDLVPTDPTRFARYLHALTEERSRALAEATREVERLEQEVAALERAGGSSDAALQRWSEADDRMAALQGRPWPHA